MKKAAEELEKSIKQVVETGSKLMQNGFEKEDPALVYTAEEKEIIDKDLAVIEKAMYEFCTKYILADKGSKDTGDAAWDAWVKKAKSSFNIADQERVANEIQKRMYN